MSGHGLTPQVLDVRDTATISLATAAAAMQQLQARQESVSAENLAEDNSAELVGIAISFAALTTILLGLRFYAKRFQAGGIFADEVFLVLAYLVNLGMCAIGISEWARPSCFRLEYIDVFVIPAKIRRVTDNFVFFTWQS